MSPTVATLEALSVFHLERGGAFKKPDFRAPIPERGTLVARRRNVMHLKRLQRVNDHVNTVVFSRFPSRVAQRPGVWNIGGHIPSTLNCQTVLHSIMKIHLTIYGRRVRKVSTPKHRDLFTANALSRPLPITSYRLKVLNGYLHYSQTSIGVLSKLNIESSSSDVCFLQLCIVYE